jgi:hypothetical protein
VSQGGWNDQRRREGAWWWRRENARVSLTLSTTRGDGASTRRRKTRRSYAHDQLGAGGTTAAIGRGGAREPAMARWPLGCSAALLWGEERRMEAAAEVGERAEGVGGRGGTRGHKRPLGGQRRHMAATGRRSSAAVGRERARGRWRAGGHERELGRLAELGRKRGSGPFNREIPFFSNFNFQNF